MLDLAESDVREIAQAIDAVGALSAAAARMLREAVAAANGSRLQVVFIAPEASRLLTTAEVARMFRLSERAVRKWCEQGRIRAMQPAGAGGEWRIPAAQFAATPEQMEHMHHTLQEIANAHGGPDDSLER